MLGSAVGSYTGAAWGDGQSTGEAMEEAMVSGIGAAGGAWATNLAGKLLKDGIGSAATKLLSNGAARRVDTAAGKVLLPWNKHDGYRQWRMSRPGIASRDAFGPVRPRGKAVPSAARLSV